MEVAIHESFCLKTKRFDTSDVGDLCITLYFKTSLSIPHTFTLKQRTQKNTVYYLK